MEAGKKPKKEELIDIIQTHLNAHPELKENTRFTGLFISRRQQGTADKENLPPSTAPSTATSQRQPSIPNPNVNFTTPYSPSMSFHPFTPLSAPRHFPEHSYPGPPHEAYYSHYNTVPSLNSPQYRS